MQISIAPLRYTGLAASAALLAGCLASNPAATPASPEQQVRERATSFWQARIKGEVPLAYGLLAPAYRLLRSEDEFVKSNGRQIALEKVEVTQVACETEKCTARLALTGKPSVPGLALPQLTTYKDDIWVLENGQWWRFEKP